LSTLQLVLDGGSFRDPSGYVLHGENAVYRAINHCAAADFEFVSRSKVLQDFTERGWLIESEAVDLGAMPVQAIRGQQPAHLIRHPRLDFVSHPYEWCFSELQDAALRHLQIQIEALSRGVALSDASAYNIQFRGSQPLHIDILSFRRYQEGERWDGYHQFCRQFLNPLLLDHDLGVGFQKWYRGGLEGIDASELAKLLPLRARYGSLRRYLHVVAQARLERSIERRAADGSGGLSSRRYLAMLEDLAHWIEGIRSKAAGPSIWLDYASNNSYAPEAEAGKRKFVESIVAEIAPRLVWDLGSNTGAYSELAVRAGAASVIAFDSDLGAVERLYARAVDKKLPILPLLMDLANPSPDQGWVQNERRGLQRRANPDLILALALIHHLVIGRNIPLADAIDWIVSLAPRGVIEFIPKTDPMVRRMLAQRTDIFADYTLVGFRAAVSRNATIERELHLEEDGRVLIAYSRHAKKPL
jgi:ribosomal protein L11 methylase PrmA